MKNYKGTGVALVTPFNSDKSIDYESLQKLVEYVINGGVDYLVVMGTTAENPTLNSIEKQSVIKFIVEKNNKRVPIVLGVGGYDTNAVIENIKQVNVNEIDAILSVTPYYNKPNQNGLYEHFSAITKNSPLPIILYNVPGRTGVNISASTTLNLAKNFNNIIAIKEASGNIEQIMEIIEKKPIGFEVISGDDRLTLPLVSVGAIGVISVVANALPKDYSNMVKLSLEGKFLEAKKLHYKLLEFNRLIFAEGSPAGVKCALKKLNIIKNYLRLPLVPVSDELSMKIENILKKSNIKL
ncbi:MAG: 4-hydroxy-tetrahydrodipicolinate synthase [Bacteroidetes bacterium CG_4_10_14_3_um_filter_31_20]|nr:MAG: 4-hydroxy-tetrahydrodipicolinate synthase [Bacteroidetes bacterium CG_4_8_14_3_um_filter_31_14]PIY04816.1 MAG: 4-hydroxy-tetrahydrodipicolinate synthase [Bacteroidetes bacterium CG_4_10_14_3_um_filter_31_20]